jgi:RNA polymerase subunit RPABC4/transcription elongation factor Spt4
MKCFNCGKEIEDNSTFCPECGISIIQLNYKYEPFIFIIDDPTLNRKFSAKLVMEEVIDRSYLSIFDSTVAYNGGIKFGFKENHQGYYMEEELNASNNDRCN